MREDCVMSELHSSQMLQQGCSAVPMDEIIIPNAVWTETSSPNSKVVKVCISTKVRVVDTQRSSLSSDLLRTYHPAVGDFSLQIGPAEVGF